MIENTKLSLWDFFVSMLLGYALVVSVLTHCLLKGIVSLASLLEYPTALLTIAGLFSIMLSGLLFEPLANFSSKLLTNWPNNYTKKLGFKDWDSKIAILKNKAKKNVPKDIGISTYQYCKNWLHQQSLD